MRDLHMFKHRWWLRLHPNGMFKHQHTQCRMWARPRDQHWRTWKRQHKSMCFQRNSTGCQHAQYHDWRQNQDLAGTCSSSLANIHKIAPYSLVQRINNNSNKIKRFSALPNTYIWVKMHPLHEDVLISISINITSLQGGSGSVQNVKFSGIRVSEVQTPIVIDQFYCDRSSCKNQTSAVALAGIDYENIRGTYTVTPVHFACSDAFPCSDITLSGVELEPLQEHYHMYEPFCWQAFGELYSPTIPPIDCLQNGKPARNGILSDHDMCWLSSSSSCNNGAHTCGRCDSCDPFAPLIQWIYRFFHPKRLYIYPYWRCYTENHSLQWCSTLLY